MRRLLSAGLLALLAFSSCETEQVDDIRKNGNGESNVKFSVWLPGTRPESRALSANDECNVQTIDILMFAQSGGGWQYSAGCSGASITTDGSDRNKKTFTIRMRHGNYDLVMFANARELIRSIDLEGKTKSEVLALMVEEVPAGGKWIANASASGYKEIPMWAEVGNMTVNDNTEITETEGITLTRMLARVDVQIDAQVSNFTITSVDVYNYNTKGSLVPPTGGWNGSANPPRATAPNVPATSVMTKGPLVYDNNDGRSEINTAGNNCAMEVYIFEAENHTGTGHTTGKEHLERCCIVVGGLYDANGNGDFTDDGPATYYRADFSTGTDASEVFLDVLRNHHYTFNITKVSEPGHDTSEDAFQGAKKIEFTVEVTPWGMDNQVPLPWEVRESSNCYIVSTGGKPFNIPIYGQMGQAIAAGELPDTWLTSDMTLGAELIWSDNSSPTAVVEQLKAYNYSDVTRALLTVNPGNTQGNALIGVYNDANKNGTRDSEEAYLWSWHIWALNKDNMPKETGGFMDRSIGSLRVGSWAVVRAVGDPVIPLTYEWGRKDPLPAGTMDRKLYDKNGAVLTIINGAVNTLAYSVQNPTRFITNWAPANSYWGAFKTAYDPCPNGYRVPTQAEYTTTWSGWDITTTYSIYNAKGGWYPLWMQFNAHYHHRLWLAGTAGNMLSLQYKGSSSLDGAVQQVLDSYWRNAEGGVTVRCINDGTAPAPVTPTLTTDSDGMFFDADGSTYNIEVTSNTAWTASVKRGTNVVTAGDADLMGQPLISAFNGTSVNNYVSGGTAGTQTVQTITITTEDIASMPNDGQGDLSIVFMDAANGSILHTTTFTVGVIMEPDYWEIEHTSAEYGYVHLYMLKENRHWDASYTDWYYYNNVPAGENTANTPPLGPQLSPPNEFSCAAVPSKDASKPWRLPTSNELRTLLQYVNANEGIAYYGFVNIYGGSYWTATYHNDDTSYAVALAGDQPGGTQGAPKYSVGLMGPAYARCVRDVD